MFLVALTVFQLSLLQPGPQYSADPVNVQLYPCNSNNPWKSRQLWELVSASNGSFHLRLQSSPQNMGYIQMQLPVPMSSNAGDGYNVIVGNKFSQALPFSYDASAGTLEVVNMKVDGEQVCLASDWSGSHGCLPNVYVVKCSSIHEKWQLNMTSLKHNCVDNFTETCLANTTAFISSTTSNDLSKNVLNAPSSQCLDVGSGGSAGNLGFKFTLAQAAPLPQQAFFSSNYSSWGGSVVVAPNSSTGENVSHMFLAVFADHAGLSQWTSKSEIMHATADSPAGPFRAKEIVVSPFAHNPEVIRANDGTYLIFSIGKETLLASKSPNGPWESQSFTSCNNPAPFQLPNRDEFYCMCHNGPNPSHWGSSVGLVWAPTWKGPWTAMRNNTDDLLDGGTLLFAHPVEDPFVWSTPDGRVHMVSHAFRMGMVNRTVAGSGNAFGGYATAPSPFGPWKFQETQVAYDNVVHFNNGSTAYLDRRERPKLLLDDDGVPQYLYNGVCPNGTHESGPSDPGGHCYTLVQKIDSIN
eukprot:m.345862 g.345862  ORF g.345862 m.345862 type:complete len:523 (-) comp27463_c0_seq1:96-1664(-)